MKWARGVAVGCVSRRLFLLHSCADTAVPPSQHALLFSLEATLKRQIFVEASLCLEQYCTNLIVLGFRAQSLVSVRRPGAEAQVRTVWGGPW